MLNAPPRSRPQLPPDARLTIARIESWELAVPFVISRGAKTTADVLYVEVSDGQTHGRGEAVPYGRYGETADSVLSSLADRAASPLELIETLAPGAARNALDLAIWDFAAKTAGVAIHELLGQPPPVRTKTCFTLSLDTPENMAAAARAVRHLNLLKLKLGGAGDAERMAAVRRARPEARLVADANEGWSAEEVPRLLQAAADAGFELVEQPLPAGDDAFLADIQRPIPVCADESIHTASDLPSLTGRYDAINLKLDKAGGLTEALALEAEARTLGFRMMVGSMVATSLAVAPALQLCRHADWVDLDGPLLLARDRQPAIAIDGGWIAPPHPDVWG